MYNEQKSTTVHQQVRQRQMTKTGETWNIGETKEVAEQNAPARKNRCVFASVNGYAQAEVVTTVRKSG